MNRFLLFPLAALLLASHAFADTETVDGIEWTYTVYDGKASIGSGDYSGAGAVPSSTSGAITIPSTLGGYPVTSIGMDAFYNCTNLVSVAIPGSVTSIGYEAFYGCSSLTSLTIPDSVTIIGWYAFRNCSNLASVHISDLVAWCGISFGSGTANPLNYAQHLFHNGTEVTNLVIPNSVTSIGAYAFSGYSGLSSVIIPDTVTNIGASAFYDCSGLASVTIGNGVTTIGSEAFRRCTELAEFSVSSDNSQYSSVNGLLLSKEGTDLLVGINGDVLIPDCVTSIGNEAFYALTNLISVTMPNSVTNIGSSAFFGCSGLASVTIGNGVTSIGEWAFYNCSGLASVHISDLAAWCGISFGEGRGYYANPLSYAHHLFLNGVELTDLVIPDGVSSIGNEAFYGLTNLAAVTMPNSVTNIGSSAFSGCSGLVTLTIPDSVVNIGNGAFSGCRGLKSFSVGANNPFYSSCNGLLLSKDGESLICGVNGNVAIPAGVTIIGSHAFSDCTRLTSVTIPDGVTSIGTEAFYNCSDLTSVEIPASVKRIGSAAFCRCDFLKSVTISAGVKDIGDSAFYDCYNLTNVDIPASVTRIGSSAFGRCSSLISITIPDSVTSIGSGAFFRSGLVSATIGNGITRIEYGLFENCAALSSVSIPDSVTSIGDNAFYGCSGLLIDTNSIRGVRLIDGWAVGSTDDLPSSLNLMGVRGIGPWAFCDCTGLTSVTIPNGVRGIGPAAFMGCSGLTSVSIPDSVTVIGNCAFYDCNSALYDTKTIPGVYLVDGWASDCNRDLLFGHLDLAGVRGIIGAAFVECPGLTSVSIPDGVASIGDYAFAECDGLTCVTIPDTVTSIEEGAFYDCRCLTSITIPQNLTYIGNEAFDSCHVGLTSLTIPNGMTSIGEGAFSGFRALTSVTIPNGVTSLGWGAFSGCSGLKSVTIPTSVSSIGYRAFQSCSGLTNLFLPSFFKADTANMGVSPGCTVVFYDASLEWGTFGGSRGWDFASDGCAIDGYSLRSATIDAGETSTIEATVEGSGVLSFDWRISSGRGTYTRLYVDGEARESITRTTNWATVNIVLGDGPHTLRWTYEKGTAAAAGEDAAFLDNVHWTLLTISPPTITEALDATNVVWTTDGDAPWFSQFAVSADGASAAQSGAVVGEAVSRLTASVSGAGTFAWSWRLDAAGNAGVDVFLDGNWLDSYAPGARWSQETLEISGEGEHTIRFEFWNAGAAGNIDDCAYLDQVSWVDDSVGGDPDPDPDPDPVASTYSVTFDPNGGTGAMAAQMVARNASAALHANTFTRVGHVFAGWARSANGAVAFKDKASVKNLAEAGKTATLYAQWTPTTYKLAFSANGGTGKMAVQTMTCGKAAALRKNAFTRSGHVFLGWAKSKGGAVAYKDAQSVKNLAAAGKSVTLYAKWAKKAYKVQFVANGGKGKMAAEAMTYGKAKKLSANKFKRTGYVFKGWAKSKALAKKGKVAYKNKKSVKNLTTTGKTVKLYAVWKKK